MVKNIILLSLSLLLLSACQPDEPKPQSSSINKIMPLGASRVEGNRPDFESYRYELWQDLVSSGWTFDLIGTRTDEASYPAFNDQDFDPDHEGRGGFTSGEILADLEEWLDETGPPDVVLFSSPGGNDLLNGLASLEQTVANVNQIVDLLQASNPSVIILIEELAPGQSSFMTAQMSADFTAMRQAVRTLADEQSTATSQVLSVDMFTGFTDAMLADEVHYNAAGAEFIATRYYAVLKEVLVR